MTLSTVLNVQLCDISSVYHVNFLSTLCFHIVMDIIANRATLSCSVVGMNQRETIRSATTQRGVVGGITMAEQVLTPDPFFIPEY